MSEPALSEVLALQEDPPLRTHSRATDVIRLLRPAQWTKNVLVFVAPGAAHLLGHPAAVVRSIAIFAVFCAAASAMYCLNDTIDVERDRVHPKKRHRPVAAGRISPALAIGIALLLAAGALAGAWFVASWQLVVVVALYAVISLSYSLWLKHVPVLELGAVASGFVLRAIAGGVAVHVPLSEWFLLLTSFGALFLVIGKRTGEQATLGETRAMHRQTLSMYTPEFLRSALTLSAAAAVTTYCLWAFDRAGLAQRGDHLVWIELSVAPVVMGALYVLRILMDRRGESPTELVLHDRMLQLLALSWAALVLVGVYG